MSLFSRNRIHGAMSGHVWSALALLSSCLAFSCGQHEYLSQEVYEQASYSNEIDVLFIVDNSESMREEQEALSENFHEFIQNLNSAAEQEQTFPHQTLLHAVSNYLFYINNMGRYLDFHLGVTTTDMSNDGDRGRLLEPFPEDPSAPVYISTDTEDVAEAFSTAVAAASPDQTVVGEEMGLDAMRRACCLSLEDPSAYDEDLRPDLTIGCADVTEDDMGGNAGFLRDGVALAVIVVTDEGDSSPSQVEDYLGFLDSLGKNYTISAIAPTLPLDETDPTTVCNPESSPAASVYRYRDAADMTGGLLLPICDDFAQALDDLGALINYLLVRFRLSRVPSPGSILVFVDGVEVPESETNGWVFDPAQNSIEFRGAAVPDYGARVEVYYRVTAATDPRTLPF